MSYEDRVRELETGLGQAYHRKTQALAITLAAVGACLLLGYASLARRALPVWYPPLALPVALVAFLRYGRERTSMARTARLLHYYQRGVDRLEGRWAGQGIAGEEFRQRDHAYAMDLNLFGRGSLFERLCTARTEIGRERLAAYLQEPVPLAEALARQQAVGELRDRTELREEVALLRQYEFAESNWQTFREWLDSPPVTFPRWIRGPALATSTCLAAIALGTFAGAISPRHGIAWSAPIVLLHAVTGLLLRGKANHVIKSVRRVSVEIGLVREGLELLARQKFTSGKLRDQVPGPAAARTVRHLERWLNILE
ncbi:MAG: hypothetical protein NTY38_29005, partial [Acidobacteria bacterium]|nr:hypothetical protein [Acidobacteriota bacterium]